MVQKLIWAGQAQCRPQPWTAKGGGVSKRRVPRPVGFAAMPWGGDDRALCAARSTAEPRFQSGQDWDRVAATRR